MGEEKRCAAKDGTIDNCFQGEENNRIDTASSSSIPVKENNPNEPKNNQKKAVMECPTDCNLHSIRRYVFG